ncbi:putative MFS family arabinose efflux permease [Yoonia maricola]|uniref:Putative MFS family arabinose efflux permease n=1 Tax=Yoonia maricola TaxID=420999 RepID=A0A2M8WNR6_9RHOB|nr:MFS transporter [Yoonia maricola]PJI92577.1 putative MFS family arabinose efflux permease [Yoonia maricola]
MPAPFSRNQYVVLFVCVAIFALGQFHRASGGVFTPILMDRYALSAATVGGLVSAMFFATIAAQVPFGIALDRIGPRMVLSICLCIIAIGTGVFAVAQSFDMALVSRILIGVGLAAMGAASHVIIARNFTARDFGYISGLVVTLGGIGGLLGTYPLAIALENLPWAVVFGSVAALTVILAAGVFRVVRTGGITNETAAEAGPQGGYLTLLRQPEFRKILALGAVAYAPITTITGLWGGPFLQDVAGLSAEQSGAVLLLLFAATIAAGYVFGLLDRNAPSRKALIYVAFVVSAACLLSLAAIANPPVSLAIGLLVIMVFSQQFYIPLGAHMRKTVADTHLGRASTLLSLVSVAAIPLMQLGFGAILDATARKGFETSDQYRIAFATMGVTILAAGLIYSTARDINDAA